MLDQALDFGDVNPFTRPIAPPFHLEWPVAMFRVTLPMIRGRSGRVSNPFENVIYALLESTGGLDEQSLAAKTCLPIDMVRNVIHRLKDNEEIDANCRVVDLGRRSYLQNKQELTYGAAMVFKELVSGRLLPFLHVVKDNVPLKTKDFPRGNHRRLHKGSEQGFLEPPSVQDIMRIVTRMKRRGAEFAESLQMSKINQIRIAPAVEEFWLDCPIAIQSHDGDFRIADPFGIGFSQILEKVLDDRLATDEILARWMTFWRKSLSKNNKTEVETRREPYDTYKNSQLYSELMFALRPRLGSHRSIDQIYASIEWALFYCCERFGRNNAVNKLGHRAPSDHAGWLTGIALSIGFEVPEGGLRAVTRGKLDDFEDGKAEMATVLAVALVQAGFDEVHPLRLIAKAYPNLIFRIRDLAESRGEQVHGRARAMPSEIELVSDEFMRSVVSTLIPSIVFSTGTRDVDAGTAADELLEARTNLQNQFGYEIIRRMGPTTEAALLNAERDWMTIKDGDDGRALVNNLYSAVQSALRGLCGMSYSVADTHQSLLVLAEENSKKSGLGSLPPVLKTVNVRRIQTALQGSDLSLGAAILAMLIASRHEILQGIAELKPDFLVVVAELLEIRGHGNHPIPIRIKEIERIRAHTIMVVSALIDLTDWT